jgi:hypothetical protein
VFYQTPIRRKSHDPIAFPGYGVYLKDDRQVPNAWIDIQVEERKYTSHRRPQITRF